VDVIFDSTDNQGRTIEILTDSREVAMRALLKVLVFKKWRSMFR
jgi:hypothetical protein